MASFEVHVEKITGKASNDAICRVNSKKITLADLSVGTLVSCFLIHGNEGFEASKAASDVYSILEKEFEEVHDSPLSSLKKAQKSIQNYQNNLEISAAFCFFVKNVCYFAKLGDKVSILIFDPPKSTTLDFESGSGLVGDGQIYLIATGAFISVFDTSVFANEADVDFADVCDGIAVDIAQEENQSEIGAAFVGIHGKEEETAENEEIEDKGEIADTENIAPVRPIVAETAVLESEDKVQTKSSFLGKITGGIFGEFAKVRHGDIGAIRKNIVIVAVLLILVLMTSAGYKIYQTKQGVKLAEFNQHFSSASSKYDEASGIVDLNAGRAREILIDAKAEIAAALALLPNDEKGKKLNSQIEAALKMTEQSANISFSQTASVSNTLNSLGIIGKNIVGISGDKLFEVNLATNDVSGVDSVFGTDSGIVFDNKAFVISGDKVWRQDFVGGKALEVGTKAGGLDVAVFFGNVYILSLDSIYKFVPVEGGYAEGTEYLASSQSFTSNSHFAIDSSIWVTAGDKILKFTRGEKEDFEVTGLPGDAAGYEFSLIFTNGDIDNLYVLDKANSALLVIGKDGTYKKVYQASEFAKTVDLIVFSDESKIYLAVGDKILEAEL